VIAFIASGCPDAGGCDWRPYDLPPDGKRILMVQSPSDSRAAERRRQNNVALNWFEELRTRVPTP
jgi:hypothetical protein